MGAGGHEGEPAGSGRLRRALLCCLLVAFAAVSGFALWLADYGRTPGPASAAKSVVLIPPGSSFADIADRLAAAGLIEDDIRFEILARLHGYAGTIQAGEFALPGGLLPLDLLRTLSQARVIQHPVTVAEGLRAVDIATLFAEGGWCEREEFLALVEDPAFIAQLGLGELASLEGYLYPDTYFLTRIPTFDARKIISMMVARFHQVWQSLGVEEARRHEVVILASIVEKETAAPEERPRIASVFLNRLERGMRLQSDPTVIYGLEEFSGDLRRDDLRRATPYNTYVVKGLPRGPICNPGREALQAVVEPAREDYLYFVSRNDGTHHFSRTLREHNRAVRKFQKAGR